MDTMTYDDALAEMLARRLSQSEPPADAGSEPGRPAWRPSSPPTQSEAVAFLVGQLSGLTQRSVEALRSETSIPELGQAALDLGAGALSVLEALPERLGTDAALKDPESLREAVSDRGIVGLVDAGAADEVIAQRLAALTRTLSDTAGELVNEGESGRLALWLLDAVKEAGQLAVWATS